MDLTRKGVLTYTTPPTPQKRNAVKVTLFFVQKSYGKIIYEINSLLPSSSKAFFRGPLPSGKGKMFTGAERREALLLVVVVVDVMPIRGIRISSPLHISPRQIIRGVGGGGGRIAGPSRVVRTGWPGTHLGTGCPGG